MANYAYTMLMSYIPITGIGELRLDSQNEQMKLGEKINKQMALMSNPNTGLLEGSEVVSHSLSSFGNVVVLSVLVRRPQIRT